MGSFRNKLGHNAAFIQLPIGLEASFKGFVDLIQEKAYFYEEDGNTLRESDIPEDMMELVKDRRQEMVGKYFACL